MNFQYIKPIEKPDFYIKKALRNSRKGKKVKTRDKEKRKILEIQQQMKLYKDSLFEDLTKIVKDFPSFNDLDEFYKELINSQININILRIKISDLTWSKRKLINIFKDYNNRIKILNSIDKSKKIQVEFYGRTSSLIKKLKNNLEFLEKSRKKMKSFPSIKTKIKTICIYGFPNVGKSTLLKRITGSNVQIEPYAFTTKKLLLGYIKKDIQLIDTPGTLNRYNKMNLIEQQAYLAIKYLAKKIIYVFDLTETCGYEVKSQLALFEKIRKDFKNKEIIIFVSKVDLLENEQVSKFKESMENQKIFFDFKLLKKYINPSTP